MSEEVEDYGLIQEIANSDVSTLRIKGQSYGRSWLKRGGVGAFMMLARKMDRLENMAAKADYDIFAALEAEGDLLDDIRDLRAYLLLVEGEYLGGYKRRWPAEPGISSPAAGAPLDQGSVSEDYRERVAQEVASIKAFGPLRDDDPVHDGGE